MTTVTRHSVLVRRSHFLDLGIASCRVDLKVRGGGAGRTSAKFALSPSKLLPPTPLPTHTPEGPPDAAGQGVRERGRGAHPQQREGGGGSARISHRGGRHVDTQVGFPSTGPPLSLRFVLLSRTLWEFAPMHACLIKPLPPLFSASLFPAFRPWPSPHRPTSPPVDSWSVENCPCAIWMHMKGGGSRIHRELLKLETMANALFRPPSFLLSENGLLQNKCHPKGLPGGLDDRHTSLDM